MNNDPRKPIVSEKQSVKVLLFFFKDLAQIWKTRTKLGDYRFQIKNIET